MLLSLKGKDNLERIFVDFKSLSSERKGMFWDQSAGIGSRIGTESLKEAKEIAWTLKTNASSLAFGEIEREGKWLKNKCSTLKNVIRGPGKVK